MKDTLTSLDDIVTHHQKKVNIFLDKLTFFYILFLWTGVIILFGLVYYFFSGESSHLLYSIPQERVYSLLDHIYFSFITATSTGFGDIIPEGFHKIISIVEVVFGLVLLAFVTSKFIAIKQNMILTEIYEISLHEKINRIRSSFLLFRQKIGLLIDIVEEKPLRKRDIDELVNHISPFEDTLQDILILLQRDQKNEFTKGVDSVELELIFHSMKQSLEKLNELIKTLNRSRLDWRRETTIKSIRKCLNHNHELLDLLAKLPSIPQQSIETITQQSYAIAEEISTELNKERKGFGVGTNFRE